MKKSVMILILILILIALTAWFYVTFEQAKRENTTLVPVTPSMTLTQKTQAPRQQPQAPNTPLLEAVSVEEVVIVPEPDTINAPREEEAALSPLSQDAPENKVIPDTLTQ